MTPELLELRLRELDLKLEAIRRKLEAHSRDLSELKEKATGAPPRPFPLRKCPP